MVSLFDVYLMCIVPKFNVFFLFLGVFGSVFSLLSIFIVAMVDSATQGDREKAPKDSFFSEESVTLIKRAIYIFIFFLIMTFSSQMIPSSKEEMATIFLVPKIANNPDINKIPANIAKLIDAKTGKYISDILDVKKKQRK